jgi:transmembrane sensor
MAKARARDEPADPRIDETGHAAIKWMVTLNSGNVTERQVRDFESWRRASSGNADAWNRMSGGLQPFDVLAQSGLPRGVVAQLHDPALRHDRRAVLKGLVGLSATGGAGAALLQRFVPMEDVLSDHYTRTAQHEQFQLADGSEVILAPRSSLNLALGPDERRLQFVHGRMMIEVARADPRPFVVDLGAGRFTASAGAFVFDRQDGRVAVTGLTGGGTLSGIGRNMTIRASERLSLDGAGVHLSKVDVDAESSWTTGLAIVDNETLGQIVEQIRPYYAGFVRLDPAVVNQRVSGVFNLFEPLAALEILARSVDLALVQTAGFWIRIQPKA